MNRIKTLKELLEFLPVLSAKHTELDGLWCPELTTEEFASDLIRLFTPDSYYFGELTPDGRLAYFANVVRENPKFMTFGLLFVDTSRRKESKQLVESILDLLRQDGITEVQFRTSRLTSSYQRWVRKFGAQPYSLIYKLDL